MKIDIRNGLCYKYVNYRFNKKSVSNEYLHQMNPIEKENFCVSIAKTLSIIFIIFGLCYAITGLIFTKYLFIYQRDFLFVQWLWEAFENVYRAMQGDWGVYNRPVVYRVLFASFPLLIIIAGPLILFLVVITEIFLKLKIDKLSERL